MQINTHSARVEELYARIFFRLTVRWQELRSFHSCGSSGIQSMQDSELTRLHDCIDWVESHPELLVDPTQKPDRSMLIEAANKNINGYKGTLDSACLIFFHAELDQAILECCQVCAEVDRSGWQAQMGDKKISVKDLLRSGVDTVITQRVIDDLDDLERRSLIDKVERLMAVCKPGSRPGEPYKGVGGSNSLAKLDLQRLKEIDNARHAVIHRPDSKTRLENPQAMEEFMQATGLFLFGLLNHCYGVKISVPHFLPTTVTG